MAPSGGRARCGPWGGLSVGKTLPRELGKAPGGARVSTGATTMAPGLHFQCLDGLLESYLFSVLDRELPHVRRPEVPSKPCPRIWLRSTGNRYRTSKSQKLRFRVRQADAKMN